MHSSFLMFYCVTDEYAITKLKLCQYKMLDYQIFKKTCEITAEIFSEEVHVFTRKFPLSYLTFYTCFKYSEILDTKIAKSVYDVCRMLSKENM